MTINNKITTTRHPVRIDGIKVGQVYKHGGAWHTDGYDSGKLINLTKILPTKNKAKSAVKDWAQARFSGKERGVE